MADPKPKGATDTTSSAQGRFTVQLSSEIRPALERQAEKIAKVLREQGLAGIEVSMAQVVTSLIKDADQRLKEQAESETEPVKE